MSVRHKTIESKRSHRDAFKLVDELSQHLKLEKARDTEDRIKCINETIKDASYANYLS